MFEYYSASPVSETNDADVIFNKHLTLDIMLH